MSVSVPLAGSKRGPSTTGVVRFINNGQQVWQELPQGDDHAFKRQREREIEHEYSSSSRRKGTILSLNHPTQKSRYDREREKHITDTVRKFIGKGVEGSGTGNASKKKRRMDPSYFRDATYHLDEACRELLSIQWLGKFMGIDGSLGVKGTGTKPHVEPIIGSERVTESWPPKRSGEDTVRAFALSSARREAQLKSASAAFKNALAQLKKDNNAYTFKYFQNVRKLSSDWVMGENLSDEFEDGMQRDSVVDVCIDCSFRSAGSRWAPKELGRLKTLSERDRPQRSLFETCVVGISPAAATSTAMQVKPPPCCAFTTIKFTVERRNGGTRICSSSLRLTDLLLDGSRRHGDPLEDLNMLLQQVQHSAFCEEIFCAIYNDAKNVQLNSKLLSGNKIGDILSGKFAVADYSASSIEVVVAKPTPIDGEEANEDIVLLVELEPIRMARVNDGLTNGTSDSNSYECQFLVRLAAQLSQCCIRESWERHKVHISKTRNTTAVEAHPLCMSTAAMEHFIRRRELDLSLADLKCHWTMTNEQLASKLCKDMLSTGTYSLVSHGRNIVLGGRVGEPPIVIKSGSKEFKCVHVFEATSILRKLDES